MATNVVEMASSKISSKGQMTLPKEICDRLKLHPGDRLDVSIEDRRIVLTPRTRGLEDVCAILPAAKRRRSIMEMERAIRARARDAS